LIINWQSGQRGWSLTELISLAVLACQFPDVVDAAVAARGAVDEAHGGQLAPVCLVHFAMASTLFAEGEYE
jgi:hypothetical protein